MPNALLAHGFLPPLTDHDGVPYESRLLPCTTDPAKWDEDAPRAVRIKAAKACWSCPAMERCDERRLALGNLASGVWAAVLLPRQQVMVLYDATVAYWIVQSGTTVPEGSHG